MKRIIILGAGLGGLVLANRLKDLDYDILIFEKRTREELGYSWYDSVKPKTFSNIGLDLPSDAIIPKQVLIMHSPKGEGIIKQPEKSKNSLDVKRDLLIDTLLSKIEGKCKIEFESNIDGLVIKNNFVKGVYTKDKEYYADMVIDACGAMSTFRVSTPDAFLMNDEIKGDHILDAYRAYYKKNDITVGQDPNVYIFPKNVGIAWCKDALEKDALDIIVGNFGELSRKDKDETIDFLVEHNPNLSKSVIFARKCKIPVRYPLGKMVANGYACVGDSAFMTTPISGSGIETALASGDFLANLIMERGEGVLSVDYLWKYQLWFMFKFGLKHAMEYVFRVMGYKLNRDDLDWAFSSGLIDEGSVAVLSLDKERINEFNPKAIINSINLAKSHKDFIKEFEKMGIAAAKAEAIVMSIPLAYDYESVKSWKNRYDDFMNSL